MKKDSYIEVRRPSDPLGRLRNLDIFLDNIFWGSVPNNGKYGKLLTSGKHSLYVEMDQHCSATLEFAIKPFEFLIFNARPPEHFLDRFKGLFNQMDFFKLKIIQKGDISVDKLKRMRGEI